ncbi:MAG: aminotransferase class I/II-fold pyridoxal phosphate-dependent enzyme [Proteobacteria bacterium]|nr:aminotransferase class I/II-fold pyridoxal phosphate-dependent enzyme [Pseudomonadota bacterium]
MSKKNKRETAVCRAFQPFGTSIFTEMTALANRTGAVNLSQGFPDFEGPEEIRQAAADAILRGPNQYVQSAGVPGLRGAVAEKMKRFYGVEVDPDSQVTVTSGASEGLTATLLGLLEPDDEVILFEPCYDLYPPIIARAGAKAVYVPLERPDFSIPKAELTRAFRPRTRAIIINNPQNPCGKVFTRDELTWIGELCREHDVVVVGDEVYEHLIYDERKHVTLLSIPELRERAVTISSTAKTFSMTGWKIGYAVASPTLSEAVRMSHQFITFCSPGALQEAMAQAISMDDIYYEELLRDYTLKREHLCSALETMGFDVLWPEGTYYASINIGRLDFEDDLVFCRYLANEVGVAAIPSSVFWKERRFGRDLVRFCFCKTKETLDEAIQRLSRWKK